MGFPLPKGKVLQYLTHQWPSVAINNMEVMASYRINILDGYCKGWLVTAVSVFWGFAAFVDSLCLVSARVSFHVTLTRKIEKVERSEVPRVHYWREAKSETE